MQQRLHPYPLRVPLLGVIAIMLLAACGIGPSDGSATTPDGQPVARAYVRSFGGPGTEHATGLVALPDGGLAISGTTDGDSQSRQQTWLRVLDRVGEPAAEPALSDQPFRPENYYARLWTSAVLDEQGAVIVSADPVPGMSVDPRDYIDGLYGDKGPMPLNLRVRWLNADGTPRWSVPLESGSWGTFTHAPGTASSDTPSRVLPARGSDGSLIGFWVLAESRAVLNRMNRSGPVSDRSRRFSHARSAVAWFLQPDGTVVSRLRLMDTYRYRQADGAEYDTVAQSDLLDAAVLEDGALAVLIYLGPSENGGTRLMRIQPDGSTHGADTPIPEDYRFSLFADEYYHGPRVFAMPDGQALVSWRNYESREVNAAYVSPTLWNFYSHARVRPAGDLFGARELPIAMVAEPHSPGFSSSIYLVTPATRSFGGDSSGLEDGDGDGYEITATGCYARAGVVAQDALPTTVPDVDGALVRPLRVLARQDDGAYFVGDFRNFRSSTCHETKQRWPAFNAPPGAERLSLSRTGSYVVVESEDAVHLLDYSGTVIWSLPVLVGSGGAPARALAGASEIAAIVREPGSAAQPVIHRYRADGTALGTVSLPAGARVHASVADAGETWMHTTGAQCNEGLLIVRSDGSAVCRRFRDWALRDPDPRMLREASGSLRVLSAPGVDLRIANGAATVHPVACPLNAAVDVGPTGTQVSFDGRNLCLADRSGAGWTRVLNQAPFDGHLLLNAVGEGSTETAPAFVAAASDGGVVVLLQVEQRGDVFSLRTGGREPYHLDLALLKFDAAGDPQWMRIFGAGRNETARGLVRMSDGGFALLGESNSLDPVTGSQDVFVIRTGPDGHVMRSANGGDDCAMCLGSIVGAEVRQLMGERERFVSPATQALALEFFDTPVTLTTGGGGQLVRAESATNARQCFGSVTDVQEPPVGDPQEPVPVDGDAPVARFTVRAMYGSPGSNPIANSEAAYFDGSGSTPTGQIARYQWDFQDDGVFDAEGNPQVFTYTTPGPKQARLRVTGTNGQTGETIVQFQVDSGIALGFGVRLEPIHEWGQPGSAIEEVGGSARCLVGSDGAPAGVCLTQSVAPDHAPLVFRAVPAAGQYFISWANGCDEARPQPDGSMHCVFHNLFPGSQRVVSALFASYEPTVIDVSLTGGASRGGARIYAVEGGIDCPTDCSEEYLGGTIVRLQAVPVVPEDFLGFNGCDSVTGTLCEIRAVGGRRQVAGVFR